MTRVEERLSDLLHQVTPDAVEVSFDAVAGRVRRRRRTAIAAVTAGVAVVAAAGAATYLTINHGGGRQAAQTLTSVNTGKVHGLPVPLVQSTLIIDPGAHETFAAPSALQLKYGPRLTATQALRKFARREGSRHTAIPASTTVQLGSLTLAGHAAMELSYGYRGPEDRCSGNGVRDTPPDRNSGQCAHWEFLDANTSRFLDSTEQPLTGSVVIDPSAGEVFTPTALPVGTSASGAQSTWDAYRGTPNEPIPSGITAEYGTLTLPKTSPNAPVQKYVYKDQPAWAYSQPGRCLPSFGPKPPPPPKSGVCVSWTFLNPLNATVLDETQQS